MTDTLAFDHFTVLTNVLYGYGTGIWQLNSNWNAWIPRTDGLTCNRVTGLLNIDTMFYCVSEDGPFRAMGDFIWQPFMTGLHGGGVYCISSLNNEVWAGWNDDLYHSFDYGTSFGKVDNCPGQGSGKKFIMTDSLFYLKDQHSFYISYDHGNSWIEEISGIPPNPPGNFQDFSVGDHFLFAACQNQLYRSAVYPVYWEPAPIPPFEHMYTIQANNSTVVMAGSPNYPVFITHDNGNSFDSLSFINSINFPILRNWDGRFYVFSEMDIWFSADEGYTWDTIPLDVEDFRITDLASNDEAMFSTGYWYFEKSCNFSPKIFITHDDGQNWESLVDNLENCGSSGFNSVHILGNRVLLGSNLNGLWSRDDILTSSKQESVVEKGGMKIFPNPAKTSFSIQIESMEGQNTGTVTLSP